MPNLEPGSLLVVIRGAFGKLQRGFRQFQRGPCFWALLIWSWDRTQQNALFLLSTLSSFRGCGRLAATAAHDLILVEVDGKCQSVQFSSVAQSCPTLCDPMNCSTPGLPVHHQLPEFTQTHVHQVSDAIQPSHPLSSPSPPAPNPSQHQSLFQ